MDDSERSYGYSEDLYHGKRAEKSYEYGAEDPVGVEGNELSPEEVAMRIEGANRDEEEPVPDPDTRGYDHGRETASYGTVESFTWENSDTEREGEKVASAPDEELAAKTTR